MSKSARDVNDERVLGSRDDIVDDNSLRANIRTSDLVFHGDSTYCSVALGRMSV